MSSNHHGLRYVWKSLVASCVCLCLKFDSAFLTRSSPARNGFVSRAKRVRLQLDNAFVFCLEVGLETPEKRTETREESFCKT